MMMFTIATICFIETIFLKILTQSKCHPWIQNCAERLKMNKITQYFVFSPFDEVVAVPVKFESTEDEVEVEQVKSKPKLDWTIVCRLIDRTFFFAFAIAFIFYNGK